MQEAKKITGLPTSTLRYWEQQIPQLNPRKDAHGNRYYKLQDIELIKQIKFIRDEMKITRIEAICNELAQGTRKTDYRQRATEILERVRKELLEIKAQI
jgi:DNA-binding transcriptional MerR regulator